MYFQFSLLSPLFILFVISAVFLLSILRGMAKQMVFLALNVLFVWWFLQGGIHFYSTLLFCLFGYGLVYSTLKSPKWSFRIGLPAIVLVFVYMRNYEFLKWILHESLQTKVLAAAGLSFLLFKIIHVMIEARSGTLGPFDFWVFINYTLNFTTFMMGPIQRYDDYREQWYGRKAAIPLTFEAYLDALLRILMGCVKAYALADFLVPFVSPSGVTITEMSSGQLLLSIYAFYFFLYLNFAGYCDIMIGVGSLFGVRPPENFNNPFIAKNISEFWLRQHISLTHWFTDYVFSPLYKQTLSSGGFFSRPLVSLNVSLLVTMLVSGLWHGTTMAFLFFGLSHGLFLVIYHTWNTMAVQSFGRRRVREWRATFWGKGVGIFLTFNAVAFAFVFFNHNLEDSFIIFRRILGL